MSPAYFDTISFKISFNSLLWSTSSPTVLLSIISFTLSLIALKSSYCNLSSIASVNSIKSSLNLSKPLFMPSFIFPKVWVPIFFTISSNFPLKSSKVWEHSFIFLYVSEFSNCFLWFSSNSFNFSIKDFNFELSACSLAISNKVFLRSSKAVSNSDKDFELNKASTFSLSNWAFSLSLSLFLSSSIRSAHLFFSSSKLRLLIKSLTLSTVSFTV